MSQLLLPEWADSFVLTGAQATAGERAAVRRDIRCGVLVTVSRGVHLPRALWEPLDAAGRYLALVRASAVVANRSHVYSHHSAAAAWSLPWVGAWPDRVHTTVPSDARVRSVSRIIRHVSSRPAVPLPIGGLSVTGLARTVVDLAVALPFASAVAVADAALRLSEHPVRGLPITALSTDELRAEVVLLPLRQGSAKARRVVEFADGRAQLPGESLSRVGMHLAGLPAPVLQQKLIGRSGKEYTVDFWWPGCRHIGEFDGKGKYVEERYLNGRSTAEAHFAEKVREDDLRAAGHGFSRWGWGTAISPRLLCQQLTAAGVR